LSNTTRRALLTTTAVIGLVSGLFGTAHADITLITPAGLTPGETFRFAFVTNGTFSATSSSISTYDSDVTSDVNLQGGATYNGITVSWQAIGSTPQLNAIDHLGTNSGLTLKQA